ncbi:hypothetical protein [Cryptosporangium sp. NPDC051539]|uniref:hypothetical protein n=1 Tax=Cryptosporangium sp. NPDC051539 TaxID=3363962 RepID=UPI0037B6D2DE
MSLTPERTEHVEFSLAVVALQMHQPLTLWASGPNPQKLLVKVCADDQDPWPCDTHEWAMQRLNTVPSPIPVSGIPCDAHPGQRVTANNGHHPDDVHEKQDDPPTV